MISPKVPRPKVGDEITAKWASDLADIIERNQILIDAGVSGINAQQTPAGIRIWISFPTNALIAKTPTGGIPAMTGVTPGKSACRIYGFDGTVLYDSLRDEDIYNMSGTVGGSKYIQVKLIDGYYFVDVEAC